MSVTKLDPSLWSSILPGCKDIKFTLCALKCSEACEVFMSDYPKLLPSGLYREKHEEVQSFIL